MMNQNPKPASGMALTAPLTTATVAAPAQPTQVAAGLTADTCRTAVQFGAFDPKYPRDGGD